MSELLYADTEEILKALENIDETPTMIDCSDCKGTGYTYFCGEPDWCGTCGGIGSTQDDSADHQRKINVIINHGV